MSPRAIDDGLIAALQALAPDAKPHTGAIRREIGCTVAELGESVQRLRNKGKIAFDRLALSTSMLAEQADTHSIGSATSTVEAGDVAEAPNDAIATGQRPAAPVPHPGEDAGEVRTPSPATVAPLDPDSDGMVLLRAIETYCAAVGLEEVRLGRLLFSYGGFVGLLRKRGTVRPDKIAAVQQFILDWPQGPPEDMFAGPPLPAEPKLPAAPRKAARRAPKPTPIAMTLVESIQTAFVEDPADLLRMLGRTHHALWRRCIALGRAIDATPAAALYRALGAGLDLIEGDIGEDAR